MIKKKLKTGLWLFLSLLYLLGQLIPVAALEPATIHVEYPMGLIGPDPNQKWAIGLTRPHASGYSYEFYADMSIQGQKVYCLKPLANISDGVGGYTALDLSTYFGNEALTQKLEWISALGFGFENDRSPEMDFATQLRIWQEISPGLITNIHPQIQEKIDRINERLKVMESNVSFEKEAVTVYGYGKEFAQTLTDTHHVLEHSIVKGTNVEWEHNGNTLKVWMNPGTHQQGQLSLHTYYTPQGTSIAYRNPYGYQDVGYITGGAGKQSHLDVKVRLGSVQIKKQDEETGERAQGEATLAGARYELIDDKTGQKKGVLTVQDNLISNRIENLPSDRTYSLKEIQAPKGYLINKNVLTADVLHHPQIQLDVKDHVITGQVELRKIITDAHNSEIVQVEKGAVFGVVLQRYVEQYGSVKEALKHTDTYANREWDRLVTDENGNARSKELAYGTYVIAQLKGQSETDLLKETFTFTVDRPDNRPVSYTINNRPSDYYLRLIKKDSDTKEVITYSGARFQIYDEKGKR